MTPTRSTYRHYLPVLLLTGTLRVFSGDATNAPSGLMAALKEGQPTMNLRLRLEGADQDNGKDDASAATARLRSGYKTAAFHGLSLAVEFEATRAADEDSYNAAGVSGNTNKAVIADPPSTELNQVYAKYELENAGLVLGRQRIVRGNARFVGDVGWRQNQQTYDAATISLKPAEGISLDYAYADQVNRIFGSESSGAQNELNGDMHLLDLAWMGPLTVGAYLYSLEIDNAAALSSSTYGAYLSGKSTVFEDKKIDYRLEIAQQTDAGDNPVEYDALYAAATASLSCPSGYGLHLGAELLGSDDGASSFKTPLATLHKFNGWADVFLVTPSNGLVDYYLGASGKLPGGLVGKLFYHVFEADDGGESYGDEIDALLVKKLAPGAKVIGKFAHYMADDYGVDTTRYSIELNLDF